jgi:hypothetical protein
VIKIVYRDLSPGLHASAQVSGRHTIISLLPGLTPNQRRAALRRIRHSGRMGHGPRVPATGLALAVGRDRIKAIMRTGAAVVRLHPAGSTLPVVLLSAAAVVFVLMATVSIHVLPGPKSSDQNPVIGGLTPGPSAPRISQSFAPSIPVPGHSTQPGQGRNGLAAGRPGAGGSAVSAGRAAEGTSGGETVFGSERGQTGAGTGLVTATSAGSGSSGSGAGPSAGSGGTGRSGSSGSGGSGSGGSGSGSSGSGSSGSGSGGSGSGGSGSGGSGSGSGSGTGTTGGSGTGSGTTSGSGGTGSSGSGSGSGSGGSGSGGSGTGTGSGGTGSSGSGSSGTGSTGSGSGSSGGSGGKLCVNLLGLVQACLG